MPRGIYLRTKENSMLGKKWSEEVKAKISKAHIGKIVSQVTRDKLSKINKGRKMSLVSRQKLSNSLKGKRPKNNLLWIGENHPMFGRKHKEESKLKMSISSKNKHKNPKTEFKKGVPSWNKGKRYYRKSTDIVTNPTQLQIRRSLEYRLWRDAVFKRDDYTCIWCGAKCARGRSVILNADHIKPFALYPELRFTVKNGRTLCKPCHMTTDSYPKNLVTGKIERDKLEKMKIKLSENAAEPLF